MHVVEFPSRSTERWTLSRDLDNLRFDILSARTLADRLRQKDAATYLAESTSPENIATTLAHLDSLLAFFGEVHGRMREATVRDCHTLADHLDSTYRGCETNGQ